MWFHSFIKLGILNLVKRYRMSIDLQNNKLANRLKRFDRNLKIIC